MGRVAGKAQRTPGEKEQHRVEITKRYVRGETQTQIAAALGVHYTTVGRDLVQIRAAWVAAYTSDYNEHAAKELARIDHLEQTYWEAWESSKADRSTRTQTVRPDEKGKLAPVQGVMETAESVGDKKWLDGIQWCIEARMRLLALVQPAPVVNNTAVMVNGTVQSPGVYAEIIETSRVARDLIADPDATATIHAALNRIAAAQKAGTQTVIPVGSE